MNDRCTGTFVNKLFATRTHSPTMNFEVISISQGLAEKTLLYRGFTAKTLVLGVDSQNTYLRGQQFKQLFKGPSTRCDKSYAIVILKTTADVTISVDQLTAKFKTWQLYTQLLEYVRQGKNRIRLVASCRWALRDNRQTLVYQGWTDKKLI